MTRINLLNLVSILSSTRKILNLYNLILILKRISYNLNPIRYYLGNNSNNNSNYLSDRKGKGKAILSSNTNLISYQFQSQSNYSNYLLKIIKESLEIISIITDNIYLFSNLTFLLPISISIPKSKSKSKLKKQQQQKIKNLNQLSNFLNLIISLINLIELNLNQNLIFKQGNNLNLNLIQLEEKYERKEFWEEDSFEEEEEDVEGTFIPNHNSKTDNNDDKIDDIQVTILAAVVDRKKLKKKIKQERLKLKSLRDEINFIRWERFRFINEFIFVGM